MLAPNIYSQITQEEQAYLQTMRSWISSIESPNQTVSVAGKLNLINSQLCEGSVTSSDTWKLGALGILFGDALHQSFEGRLRWVMVHDESGDSPALQWETTEYLVFPISTLRTRVQSGEAVDVYSLFTEYSQMFPFKSR